ncbi:leucine-rich repeat-containing protein 74B-like [Equus caballus]|uniref:leucine-rich repeat-containing protein 74B-like n=1 Tax=Equus caballus TaxID=9796 RepID=UPI0038B38D02
MSSRDYIPPHPGLGVLLKDTLSLRSPQAHSVMPASWFLCQGSAPELNLWHHGLGPQGARALASMLTSNRCVKWLELSDTGLCGAGAQVLAGVLSRSSSICNVDLSENQPGVVGAQAVCAALTVTPAMQRVQLAGNSLEEQAAQYLAELLLAHMGLKPLDLSYSQLSDQSVLLSRSSPSGNPGGRNPCSARKGSGVRFGVLQSVQGDPVSAQELL